MTYGCEKHCTQHIESDVSDVWRFFLLSFTKLNWVQVNNSILSGSDECGGEDRHRGHSNLTRSEISSVKILRRLFIHVEKIGLNSNISVLNLGVSCFECLPAQRIYCFICVFPRSFQKNECHHSFISHRFQFIDHNYSEFRRSIYELLRWSLNKV
jgi:hypothetical protein